MKFKNLVSIVLLVCMVFSLSACKSGAAASKELTETLMTSLATYDINAISKCVEDVPDNTGTTAVVDIYTSDYYMDIYAAANANLTYTVSSSSAKEIVLKVNMPDLVSLYNKCWNTALSGALSDAELQKLVIEGSTSFDPNLLVPALMLNELKSGSVSTVEKEIKLSVVKINGEFKIKTDEQLKCLLSDGLSELKVFANQGNN